MSTSEAAGNDGVDHGGGLVVEHDFRLRGESAGDGDGTLASGGEAGRKCVCHIFGPHQADEPLDDLLNLIFGQAAAFAKREGHIFADAEGIEQGAVLEDHGDALANGAHSLFGEGVDLFALDADGADMRLEKTHENAQGHRFADAASAQNAESLAAVDEEADVVKDLAVSEPHGDVAEGDDGSKTRILQHSPA